MKEIINKFKEYDVLNLNSDKEEYHFCIRVFKAWCKYVEYPYNETSFYHFILEFEVDEIKLENDYIHLCKSNASTLTLFYLKKSNVTYYRSSLDYCITESDYCELLKVDRFYNNPF